MNEVCAQVYAKIPNRSTSQSSLYQLWLTLSSELFQLCRWPTNPGITPFSPHILIQHDSPLPEVEAWRISANLKQICCTTGGDFPAHSFDFSCAQLDGRAGWSLLVQADSSHASRHSSQHEAKLHCVERKIVGPARMLIRCGSTEVLKSALEPSTFDEFSECCRVGTVPLLSCFRLKSILNAP